MTPRDRALFVPEKLPNVPVIVHNIPQFTGVEFTKENAGRLLGKYGWTLRGVDCGFCRAPFRLLGPEARQSMAELMALSLEAI